MQSRNGKRPEQVQVLSPMKGLLRPLTQIQLVYQAFDAVEKGLARTIGVPICISGCGKCCEVTTATASEVEVEYLASWLLGEPTELIKVLSLCAGWLLDGHPRLKTYKLSGSLTDEQWKALQPEVHELLFRSTCPFLTSDKRCGIHDARPLMCRAYGVSHMPGTICPRPLSKLESLDVRAHISVTSQTGMRLRKMVSEVQKASVLIGQGGFGFISTTLFGKLRPAKLNEYVGSGLIASAKLVYMRSDPAILFQDQLDREWATQAKLAQEQPIIPAPS